MFDRVSKGQPLSISADDWNGAMEAAADHRKDAGEFGSGPVQFERGSGIVNIVNNTSTNLDQFSVLGVTGVAITPTDNASDFKRQPTFTGGTPSTSSHIGKFVILSTPLNDGCIGKAFAFGVCPALVNVTSTSHEYADIKAGDATQLQSATSGMAQILWAESGTGSKWAVVRLGSSSQANQPVLVNLLGNASMGGVYSVGELAKPTLNVNVSSSTFSASTIGTAGSASGYLFNLPEMGKTTHDLTHTSNTATVVLAIRWHTNSNGDRIYVGIGVWPGC